MSRKGAWNDERGFTLVEVLFTIIIMGVVLAIASSSGFGDLLPENWLSLIFDTAGEFIMPLPVEP